MDAEFKNKKEVVFDGKDLIFNVDGIEIRNGKLPDSFSIKERYEDKRGKALPSLS